MNTTKNKKEVDNTIITIITTISPPPQKELISSIVGCPDLCDPSIASLPADLIKDLFSALLSEKCSNSLKPPKMLTKPLLSTSSVTRLVV